MFWKKNSANSAFRLGVFNEVSMTNLFLSRSSEVIVHQDHLNGIFCLISWFQYGFKVDGGNIIITRLYYWFNMNQQSAIYLKFETLFHGTLSFNDNDVTIGMALVNKKDHIIALTKQINIKEKG